MAITISSADKALKTYYLDAVAEQLNTKINPFLAQIKQTSNDVFGKEVRKLVVTGHTGGIVAGDETSDLPSAYSNKYEQFVSKLKNLYGRIEISDKVIRASQNDSGAFLNLLNAEMEGLVKASENVLGKMIYGNGKGYLGAVLSDFSETEYYVDNVNNFEAGMELAVCNIDKVIIPDSLRVVSVDKSKGTITCEGDATSIILQGYSFYQKGVGEKQLTGIEAIFDDSVTTLYGLNKASNPWLKPYVRTNANTLTQEMIQKAIDVTEENSGSQPNIILCSFGVRRALQKLFASNRCITDVVDLDGGYKAISYNGIPIVADRFCPNGTMYLLNTNDFTMNQLCDWQWLETDNGKILQQVPGKPVYTATLVKYAELMCSRPCGQAKISGITEA